MSTETKQPNYWKSLNELAQNEEYKNYVHREFPENATELNDGVSRRSFLKVMGASIALAGFAACRRPVQKILPYSHQPENVKEGIPLYYASAMPFQDVLSGILVESNEGRPTKVEGNEKHPGSLGATNLFAQASVLGLYDPDRSRNVTKDGSASSWSAFTSFANEHFANRDQKIAVISEANSSLTLNGLKNKFLSEFGNAEWVTYEPFNEENVLEGNKTAFGKRLRSANMYDKAEVIVSIDDDFLNPAVNKNSVEATKRFSAGRKVRSTSDTMSRFFMIESAFSLTGTNADNRMQLRASETQLFTFALAAALSKKVSGLEAFSGYSNKYSDHHWISVLVEELTSHQGASVLTAGPQHARSVHAAVAAMNKALGNVSKTVKYFELPFDSGKDNDAAFLKMIEDLKAGEYDTVLLLGTNPALTAGKDLDVARAIKNTPVSIHLSEYVDETSKLVNWHLNRAHFLEAWNDGYSYMGTASVVQPLIRPLHGGKNELELLNLITNGNDDSAYKLVQDTWKGRFRSGFTTKWKTLLHDGVYSTEEFDSYTGRLSRAFNRSMSGSLDNLPGNSAMELVFRPDNCLFDGRFANNGWLQELPDPVTKITWDNVALMSKNTADELGVSNEDVVKINANGAEVNLAAWILPGHADNSITVPVGYGREGIGKVADGAGKNTYTLRNSASPFFAEGASVSATGGTYEIACTQDHQSMEGRHLVRLNTLEEYRQNPKFASFKETFGHEVPGKEEARELGEKDPVSLFDEQTYPEYEPQWGMAIDLNACTGCSACIVACQSENNIPVIGKREVRRGREMHWLRADRYFEGSVEEPYAVHQPVPCMHCELAPCEQVCPVAATTHSEDGMNQMTYNRCIGTRYCANNCPYKVRRFNFFNYTREFVGEGKDPELVQMAMNPEVTVRFRGVMEKCTYCVQRVNRAKINRKVETGTSSKPVDGTVKTACQQACPADAISFGDITDKNAEVTRLKNNERNYALLEELNTRPRTTYLARLRNPNPELVPATAKSNDHH